MTDSAMTEAEKGSTPANQPEVAEALIDAEKTYKISVISAILFCLASFLIIMSTRMG